MALKKITKRVSYIYLLGVDVLCLKKHLVAHCFESTAGRYKIKFNDIHKNNMYFPLDNLIRLYVICSLPDKHNFLLKRLLQFCIALIGCPILGFYGENCSIPCPQSYFCHITEGTRLGCLPGYYGQNCSKSCSQNCFCNITEGTCLHCIPGYMGLNCIESK